MCKISVKYPNSDNKLRLSKSHASCEKKKEKEKKGKEKKIFSYFFESLGLLE